MEPAKLREALAISWPKQQRESRVTGVITGRSIKNSEKDPAFVT